MSDVSARDMWRVLEPPHGVTYFAPACLTALKAVGLRGFWMGYFAGRAAPLGAVGPGVVEAVFYNFRSDMVRRAIPDAWTFAAPEAVLEARRTSAARVLGELVPDLADLATAALPPLRAAIEAAPACGRALFAANRDLPLPDAPGEALWQAVTTLREHRGDGHFATLLAEGLDGCEAVVLFAAATGTAPDMWRDIRGWSETDWAAAASRLTARGLLSESGAITDAGRALGEHIEARTDALAATAYRDIPGLEQARRALLPAARAVQETGLVRSADFLRAGPV
ncbi:SCO6745 family protein [Nocardia sp. NPDC003482]